jgi:transmembrane sensor
VDWFVKLRAEPVTAETDQAFKAWLDQDPVNELEFWRCEVAIELARELQDDPELQPYVEECAELAANYRRRKTGGERHALRRSWSRPVLLAASIAVAAVIAFLINFPAGYETAIGEQRTVILPDQTSVTLNTNTKITVDYSEHVRRVRLKQGEAFFSVKPNKDRPFEVLAGAGVVRAVGTAFNVTKKGAEITVAVLEGSVEVTPARREQQQSVVNAPPPRLTVGESVTYWENGAIAQVVNADTQRIQAWRQGKLEFNALRLADAIAEHNRYARQKIVIGSDELKSLLVSGVFRIGDTESFLFLLENSLGLQTVNQADVIVLLSKKKLKGADGNNRNIDKSSPSAGEAPPSS